MRINIFTFALFLIMAWFSPLSLVVAQEQKVRAYLTPEERREAGEPTEITPWLSLSALAELEYESIWLKSFEDVPDEVQDQANVSIESLIIINPFEGIVAELVYEYDYQDRVHDFDEILIELEYKPFSVEFGKIYLPFGEYVSHFVTGPDLEFAETRGHGLALSYSTFDERLELFLFAYEARAKRVEKSSIDIDWGGGLEFSPSDGQVFGLSYISDLADSTHGLLEDFGHRYLRKVAGVSAYGVIFYKDFNFSAEFVSALASFRELDEETNRPFAWNVEAAYTAFNTLQLALRYEQSEELEEGASRRYGVGASMLLYEKMTVSLEYLYSEYRLGFLEGASETSIKNSSTVAIQFSYLF